MSTTKRRSIGGRRGRSYANLAASLLATVLSIRSIGRSYDARRAVWMYRCSDVPRRPRSRFAGSCSPREHVAGEAGHGPLPDVLQPGGRAAVRSRRLAVTLVRV